MEGLVEEEEIGHSIMVVLNRILAICLFVVSGVAVLLGILSLPPEGLFFALAFLLFMIGAFFAILGGLHLVAVKGFRKHAPWRWIIQFIPIISLSIVIILFLTW